MSKPLESKCDGCANKFAYLFEASDGNYCMNCTAVRYGNDTVMKVMQNISVTQADLWQNAITSDEINEMEIYDKFGDDVVEGEIAKLITMGIVESVKYMSFTSCRDGTCSEGAKMMYVDKPQLVSMLTTSTQTIIDIRARDSKEELYSDPRNINYLKEEVVRQFQELTKGGISCFHFLAMMYVHFKHTGLALPVVSNHGTTKNYNLKSLKLEKCRYKDRDIEPEVATRLVNMCQGIIDVPENFDGKTTNFNKFNRMYEEDTAYKEITSLLGEYHRRSNHQKDVEKLTKKQYNFLKDNDYPLRFDAVEEEGIILGNCKQCHSVFPMLDNEIIEKVVEQKTPVVQESIVEKTLSDLPMVSDSFIKADKDAQKKVSKKKKKKGDYMNLRDAIEELAVLGIKNQAKLLKAKKDGYAHRVPKNPVQYYEGAFKWIDVRNFKVKKGEKTAVRVDRALKTLKDNWKFYERKPDGFFLVLFDDWGVFKTNDPFKHRFFTEFVNLRQTAEGRRQLFEALSSGRYDMKFGHFPKSVSSSAPSKKVIPMSSDVTNVVEEIDYDKLLEDDDYELGVHKILSETDELLPMDPNSKAYQLHVRIVIQELWIAVMKLGEREVRNIEKFRKDAKNVMAKNCISRFMGEYALIKRMKKDIMKSDYRGYEPNMMQLYGTWMTKARKGYGNFSSTGTGKTDQAIITTRMTESKNTLVICPDTIKDQWGNMIQHDYPLSHISISRKKGDAVFPYVLDKNAYRYHIINFQKFGREESADDLLDEICKTKVHMVVIDEAQNVKQRDEEKQSNTRENVEILLERLRQRNPNLIVLFLSATPVINNLTEGVKLLEMISNRKFPNLKTSNQVRNASRLYMEYLEYSLRFKIDYKINVVKPPAFTTQTYIPTRIPASELRDYNYSDWEIMCTPDRLPKMIELAKKHGKVIIYTEYVTKVVDQIRNAFVKEVNPFTGKNFRVSTYTGQKDGKEGLKKKTDQKGVFTNPFQNGDIDVLIASSPIAEGIDGLQKICNCIIFNGVTWTFARYEQIVGRIVRTGQTKDDVYLYTVISRIENYDFDKRIKVDRLYQKEMLQKCVLDGYIPNIKEWTKKTKDYYHDFVECVLKDRKSRVATKKQIRDSGVSEA